MVKCQLNVITKNMSVGCYVIPSIDIRILLTRFHRFLMVLIGRICVNITERFYFSSSCLLLSLSVCLSNIVRKSQLLITVWAQKGTLNCQEIVYVSM